MRDVLSDFIIRFWEPALYFAGFLSVLFLMHRANRLVDRLVRNQNFAGWDRDSDVVADYRIMVASWGFIARHCGAVFIALAFMVGYLWYAYLYPEKISGVMALMVVVVAFAIPVEPFILLRDITRRYEYDPHQIRKSSVYGRSRPRNLRDIIDVKAPSRGFRSGVVLVFEDQHEMFVSAKHDGFGDFLNILERHSPVAVGLRVVCKALPNPKGGYREGVL